MNSILKTFTAAIVSTVLTLSIHVTLMASSCTTTCSYKGCDVTLVQGGGSHTIVTVCGDGYHAAETYTGSFEGTLCGGVTPCTAMG